MPSPLENLKGDWATGSCPSLSVTRCRAPTGLNVITWSTYWTLSDDILDNNNMVRGEIYPDLS